MIFLHFCALSALCVFGAENGQNDWENLAVNSRHRMEAASYLRHVDSRYTVTAPLSADRDILSLNGDWKFKWVGDPARRPVDFWKKGYDDSKWGVIDVPSCVEMRGYGVPHYTNIRYPHKNAWPKILDRASSLANYNPVSSYRRTFELPEIFKGREVILRFDGVYSAYYIWVNGEMAGYAEDSHLPSEFNVTKFVKEGQNEIAVQVFRWCDGSYLEDQDFFRYNGIFRDVYILKRCGSHVRDVKVKTTQDTVCAGAFLTGEVEGSTVAFELYDKNNKLLQSVSCLAEHDTATAHFTVDNPILWNAEKPYLYKLLHELIHHFHQHLL